MHNTLLKKNIVMSIFRKILKCTIVNTLFQTTTDNNQLQCHLSDSGDLKLSIPNIVSNKHDLLQLLVKIGCILKQTLFTLQKLFISSFVNNAIFIMSNDVQLTDDINWNYSFFVLYFLIDFT